eukprot:COSAG01_NODE_1299_length_10836_cov_8.277452_3_plen_66_part_00
MQATEKQIGQGYTSLLGFLPATTMHNRESVCDIRIECDVHVSQQVVAVISVARGGGQIDEQCTCR